MRIKHPALGLALCVLAFSGHARSTGRIRTTAETAHFFITAERGRGDAAQEAAARLEAAFATLSSFFDFTPAEKIQVVLVDDEDYSNGFAYAANSWVVLYMPPSRFDLRGPTAWIPNVSAHELAHVITLRKMGITSRFLGVEAFASLGFSRVRADASVSWLPEDVPVWLAEGLAQYASMHAGFDTLDARRRMVLREAWKTGALIPLKAMETFSGDGRSGELIYNQGFHLVDFLYRTRGRESVNAMLKAWDDRGYRGAFQSALGATPEAIYAEWREELDKTLEKDEKVGGLPGAVYRVETAPVRDAERDILYFLSSDKNDYGITHLYARRGNRTRLIYRNVEAAPQLAADGSLLFASIRTAPSTGARTGDLYRYLPDAKRVERVTRKQRAFAGAQAGADVFALVYHNGRTRLARYSRYDKDRPTRWLDAPAGTEFSGIAAAGDSALYLTVVRGTNADIFRLDPGTGVLTPLEASPYNEMDPQVHDGRLYFASDRSGEYAVYSRDGETLHRHTPVGVSAFRPFVAADESGEESMWYSAYAPEGFRIRSSPLESGAPATNNAASNAIRSPVDTANHPFPSPSGVPIRNLRRDAAGKEWAAYYATLGYSLSRSVDVTDFFGSSDVFTLNPCGQHAYAGGGSLWSDPAERSALSFDVLGAQCLDGTPHAGFHVPAASVTYISRNLTPDILVQAQYQSLQVGRDLGYKTIVGTVHDFSVIGAAQLHLGDYFSTTPFGQIGGTVADLREGESTAGVGLAAGNTFGFAVVEPGVDYINQGLYSDATVILSGGAAAFVGDAGVFANVKRRLFLGANADATRTTESGDSFVGGFAFSADTRFPLGVTLGSAGYRGMHFESIFLRTGYSRRWNTSSGFGMTQGNGFRADAIRPATLTSLTSLTSKRPDRYAAAPVAQVQYLTPQVIRLGLRLKAISPGSRTVYWDANWEAPPTGFKDGYFSVSLSL